MNDGRNESCLFCLHGGGTPAVNKDTGEPSEDIFVTKCSVLKTTHMHRTRKQLQGMAGKCPRYSDTRKMSKREKDKHRIDSKVEKVRIG